MKYNGAAVKTVSRRPSRSMDFNMTRHPMPRKQDPVAAVCDRSLAGPEAEARKEKNEEASRGSAASTLTERRYIRLIVFSGGLRPSLTGLEAEVWKESE
jgi:hypothetical protein